MMAYNLEYAFKNWLLDNVFIPFFYYFDTSSH